MPATGTAFCSILLLQVGVLGFGILPESSQDHLEITERAILNVTVQACRALAESEGNQFTLPPQPFTVTGVAVACRAQSSVRSFQQAVRSIVLRNVRVDIQRALNSSFHFDDESFAGGRSIIVQGLQTVMASTLEGNFEGARESLGTISHPLQDFYSHSNWVELGNTFPNPNLIKSDTGIGNIAAPSRATCRSCDGDDCRDNILEDIIREQILTSGYFSLNPISATKPNGKCSHGGAIDQTSSLEPTGGINKDTFGSDHGFLHMEAADMATAATSQMLENIREAAGDVPFLRMLGISRGSGKALCLVIDTTQSMADAIAAVRDAASLLVDGQAGTDNEPSSYLLVPFNDPGVGPLNRTDDAGVLENLLEDLSASGGGDDLELSLGGLRLALSNVPQSSDIFLFTDAAAKDRQLKSSVIVLIERTQSVVYFLLVGTTTGNRQRGRPRPIPARRRRRRRQQQRGNGIAPSDAQLYRDLAQAAGGLVIQVEREELSEATQIIGQLSNSSVVTLVQASWNPGRDESFAFRVDQTTNNVRIFLTGNPERLVLTDPAGSTVTVGEAGAESSIASSRSVGNFRSLELKKKVGEWRATVPSTATSAGPYSLRVTGQSPIDFLFDFVEYVPSQNTFDVLDTRPSAGTNATLLVTLTGSDTATVTNVSLVESAGLREVEGLVEPQGSGGGFLVRVSRIPSVPFVVRVKGEEVNGGGGDAFLFQRQSPTSFRASNLSIEAQAESILVPGSPFSVPFSVSAEGGGGNVSIRITTNDPLYVTDGPESLALEPGVSAGGVAGVSVPLNTPSGATVTLVIEAEGPGELGINYIVLRISVFNPVSDFTAPVCELLSVVNCLQNSSDASWNLTVRVSDGPQGTGVERVNLTRGDGTLLLAPAPGDPDVILATYNASCDSPELGLAVADRVGNVDTCSFDAFTANSGAARVMLERWGLNYVALGLALEVTRRLNLW
ncbi:von Willebrand factor A domain-containing protein 7-like [Stigmatopora nigra]